MTYRVFHVNKCKMDTIMYGSEVFSNYTEMLYKIVRGMTFIHKVVAHIWATCPYLGRNFVMGGLSFAYIRTDVCTSAARVVHRKAAHIGRSPVAFF